MIKKVFNNPLFVALDLDSAEKALELAESLSDVAGGFKVGPRLAYRYGSDIVQKLSKFGPVFLDCKFFDIPSVMEASVQAAFDSRASLCTVHATAGPEALERLAKLEVKLNKERPFQILAVTLLTSFNSETLPPVFRTQKIADHVLQLAQLTADCGMTGIVCSGEELSLFSSSPQLKGLMKVCPGIRMRADDSQDQKRVVDPQEARKNGATLIVVGRPILEAPSIRQAALNYSVALFEP